MGLSSNVALSQKLINVKTSIAITSPTFGFSYELFIDTILSIFENQNGLN